MERKMEVWAQAMKVVVNYFRENPPPEYEFELRAVLTTMRRELREIEREAQL